MFDINALDQQALDTPDGLDIALRAIEAVCHQGDPGIAGMVAALSGHSHTLEYILSGTSCLTAIGPCASLALTVPPSSAGGGGIREALKVDCYRISHTRNPEYDGYYEHAAPTQVFVLVVIRGVSVHCQSTPQPPHLLEEGGTLVRCPEES